MSSRVDVEDRVDAAEEMLCAGLSPGTVERRLAEQYKVTTRQSRKYIARVYERWKKQTVADAPHRREKVIRMAERFFAKATANQQYTAAANVLNLLAKLSGAFAPAEHQLDVAKLIGPMPENPDPTQALVWAQKAMLIGLREVVEGTAIDPEKRLRWISEIGGKIGMTYAKTLTQHRVEEIANRFLPAASGFDDADGHDVAPEQWNGFRNARSGDEGPEPVPGHGAGPAPSDDGGMAPEGGGPMGPPKTPVH